jgi:hypothetical protein
MAASPVSLESGKANDRLGAGGLPAGLCIEAKHRGVVRE